MTEIDDIEKRIQKAYQCIQSSQHNDLNNELQEFILNENKFVDSCIYHLKNHDNNYHLSKILIAINSKYCVFSAIKNKLYSINLFVLYNNYSNLIEVKNFIFTYFYYDVININFKYLKIFLENSQNKFNRSLLCKLYFKHHENSMFKKEIIKILIELAKFRKEDENVEKIFGHALKDTKIISIKQIAEICELNDDYHKIKYDIDRNFVIELAEKKDYSKLLLFCINKKKYFNIVESYHEEIQNVIMEKFQESRFDQPDFMLYQDYYDELLCISLIGKYTSDKIIFEKIYDFVNKNIYTDKYKGSYFKGDKMTANNIYYSLSKNKKYGNMIKKYNNRNTIELGYTMICHEDLYLKLNNIYLQYLIKLYKKDENKKICVLFFKKYYNSQTQNKKIINFMKNIN